MSRSERLKMNFLISHFHQESCILAAGPTVCLRDKFNNTRLRTLSSQSHFFQPRPSLCPNVIFTRKHLSHQHPVILSLFCCISTTATAIRHVTCLLRKLHLLGIKTQWELGPHMYNLSKSQSPAKDCPPQSLAKWINKF